ncbi:MAG: Ig domain protein group 2 domain protein, partial [Chitinophagaceae bacterium]|nr:Ig domain protein group 2 domain protein [Chitinophagaceae bacterium]
RLPDKEFDLAALQFNNQSSSDVFLNYWQFGNGSTSNDKDPLAYFQVQDTNSRNVMLVVTNNENCTDTFMMATGSLISDFVFYLPNAFSPDANNLNDTYQPTATIYVRSYRMEIFNMWGELVFESTDITRGWDGKYKGEVCPQGLYLCKVYMVPLRGKLRHHEVVLTLLR